MACNLLTYRINCKDRECEWSETAKKHPEGKCKTGIIYFLSARNFLLQMWKAILGDARLMSLRPLAIGRLRAKPIRVASSSLSSQFNLIDKVHSKIIIIIIQKQKVWRNTQTRRSISTWRSLDDSMAIISEIKKCLRAKLIQFWVRSLITYCFMTIATDGRVGLGLTSSFEKNLK